MRKRFFILLVTLLCHCAHFAQVNGTKPQGDQSFALSYDQVGYPALGGKFLVVNQTTDAPPPATLTLKPLLDQSPSMTIQLVPITSWESPGVKKWGALFEGAMMPGDYAITIGEHPASQTLHVGTDGYTKVLKDVLRFYYFQRASVAIRDDHAPQRSRPLGHPDLNLKFYPVHSGATRAAPGGWYDAGDYGKYVVNAGITVATLLSISHFAPNLIGDSSAIPESTNNKSDLLDEVKFELDWLKTMQDEKDGGVYSKVAGLYWPGMVAPERDIQDRYLFPKATNATLNFAAVMAQAARVYQSWDPDYAKDCLVRATKAISWALKNPNQKVPLVKDGSGNYDGGSYEDEYFWALTELYLSTGKKLYLDYLTGKKKISGLSNIQRLLARPDIHGPADWGMGEPPTTGVTNLAYFSILSSPENAAPIDVGAVRMELLKYGNSILEQIATNPFKVPLDRAEFVWGSNSIAANKGVVLAYAYQLSHDRKYLDGVYEILHYLFGRNALSMSMVTGHGFVSPRHPHHRISGATEQLLPIPGMLIGGPNQRKEDHLEYGPCLPEKCYLDERASFASNEVAINWNAPLAVMLATVLNEPPSNNR
ncbi:MAG: hypothetical protein FJ146_17940 [Deltaproteobacteria bacterium]|nr:hypothetical protein [Deltaproteobacteria bacterium]